MKYDFESIIERKGMDAIAVDALGEMPGMAPDLPKEGFTPIPMWVADMNFKTVPSVPEAIIKRAEHSLYGYFSPTEEYFSSIIRWQEKRNGVTGLTKEYIGYENGVLGGVLSALAVFAAPGDAVLLHNPCYNGFTESLGNCGYRIVHSQLKQDEKGVWRMDFEDMDRKIKENRIHAAIFCSPHNPCGRVWERWELEQAMEIYRKNDCMVISDEIWSDLTMPGYHHIPTQSVSEDARNRTVALYAPSKTFNLAGIVGSYHIIYNKQLRELVEARSSKSHYNGMNVFSMHSLIGAYSQEGEEWLEELREVLDGNIRYAREYIEEHFEGVHASVVEGTYMLLVNYQEWCEANKKTGEQVVKAGWDAGVMWADGMLYNAPYSVRVNLALPFSKVKEAFDRLGKHVFC